MVGGIGGQSRLVIPGTAGEMDGVEIALEGRVLFGPCPVRTEQ